MSPNQTPDQNHLLAALPVQTFDRLSPHLELVSLPLGDVLYESGGALNYVYFPTAAILSMQYVMENGASSEIAGVGKEGVLGITLLMGGGTTSPRAIKLIHHYAGFQSIPVSRSLNCGSSGRSTATHK